MENWENSLFPQTHTVKHNRSKHIQITRLSTAFSWWRGEEVWSIFIEHHVHVPVPEFAQCHCISKRLWRGDSGKERETSECRNKGNRRNNSLMKFRDFVDDKWVFFWVLERFSVGKMAKREAKKIKLNRLVVFYGKWIKGREREGGKGIFETTWMVLKLMK